MNLDRRTTTTKTMTKISALQSILHGCTMEEEAAQNGIISYLPLPESLKLLELLEPAARALPIRGVGSPWSRESESEAEIEVCWFLWSRLRTTELPSTDLTARPLMSFFSSSWWTGPGLTCGCNLWVGGPGFLLLM